MMALEFADRLELTRSNGEGSRFSIRFNNDPANARVDWTLDQDLGYRAHALLSQHVGLALPINLVLKKRIPPGAGLGGGSSDAAGVLVGLNRLFKLGLHGPQLKTIGGQLGSDVPFLIAALLGQPAAIVRGTGDDVEPVPDHRVLHFVLIFPPFGCSTSHVYCQFDELVGINRSVDLGRVYGLTTCDPVDPDAFFNDLAVAAGRIEPRLAKIRGELEVQMVRRVHVSGSGSTLFMVAPNASAGRQLAQQVTARTGLPTVATRTLCIAK